MFTWLIFCADVLEQSHTQPPQADEAVAKPTQDHVAPVKSSKVEDTKVTSSLGALLASNEPVDSPSSAGKKASCCYPQSVVRAVVSCLAI